MIIAVQPHSKTGEIELAVKSKFTGKNKNIFSFAIVN